MVNVLFPPFGDGRVDVVEQTANEAATHSDHHKAHEIEQIECADARCLVARKLNQSVLFQLSAAPAKARQHSQHCEVAHCGTEKGPPVQA